VCKNWFLFPIIKWDWKDDELYVLNRWTSVDFNEKLVLVFAVSVVPIIKWDWKDDELHVLNRWTSVDFNEKLVLVFTVSVVLPDALDLSDLFVCLADFVLLVRSIVLRSCPSCSWLAGSIWSLLSFIRGRFLPAVLPVWSCLLFSVCPPAEFSELFLPPASGPLTNGSVVPGVCSRSQFSFLASVPAPGRWTGFLLPPFFQLGFSPAPQARTPADSCWWIELWFCRRNGLIFVCVLLVLRQESSSVFGCLLLPLFSFSGSYFLSSLSCSSTRGLPRPRLLRRKLCAPAVSRLTISVWISFLPPVESLVFPAQICAPVSGSSWISCAVTCFPARAPGARQRFPPARPARSLRFFVQSGAASRVLASLRRPLIPRGSACQSAAGFDSCCSAAGRLRVFFVRPWVYVQEHAASFSFGLVFHCRHWNPVLFLSWRF
jgi:hypothetical protein